MEPLQPGGDDGSCVSTKGADSANAGMHIRNTMKPINALYFIQSKFLCFKVTHFIGFFISFYTLYEKQLQSD